MPSPFHQKYSSQNHKVFSEIPAIPDPPAASRQSTDEKPVDASPTSSSPPERRRSSATSRFVNLEALKRPNTEEAAARRAGMQDHKIGSTGVVGSLWNTFTRGPTTVVQGKETKDTST